MASLTARVLFPVVFLLLTSTLPVTCPATELELGTFPAYKTFISDPGVPVGRHFACLERRSGLRFNVEDFPGLRLLNNLESGSVTAGFPLTEHLPGPDITASEPLLLDKWFWLENMDASSNVTVGVRGSNQVAWLRSQGIESYMTNSFSHAFRLLRSGRVRRMLVDERAILYFFEHSMDTRGHWQHHFVRYEGLGFVIRTDFLEQHPGMLEQLNHSIRLCSENRPLSPAESHRLTSVYRKDAEVVAGMVGMVAGRRLSDDSIRALSHYLHNRGCVTELILSDAQGREIWSSLAAADRDAEDELISGRINGAQGIWVSDIYLDPETHQYQVQVSQPLQLSSGKPLYLTMAYDVEKERTLSPGV